MQKCGEENLASKRHQKWNETVRPHCKCEAIVASGDSTDGDVNDNDADPPRLGVQGADVAHLVVAAVGMLGTAFRECGTPRFFRARGTFEKTFGKVPKRKPSL